MVWKESCEVKVGEVMAARQRVKIAMEADFRKFVLEMDNVKLYETLKHKKWENSAFGSIQNDIYMLLVQCQEDSFSFVKRTRNKVAHAL